MNNFKINGTDPDNIMSKGQQVDRIYSKGTLVWEKSFPEVTIGTQTWKVKNLDIDDGLGGIANTDLDIVANYGRYYKLEAALRIAASIDGWHVPTLCEWDILINYLGGYNSATAASLKTTGTEYWNTANGTNTNGFSLKGAGYTFADNPSYSDLKNKAYMITATPDEYREENYPDYHMILPVFDDNRIYNNFTCSGSYHPVRLIKDYSHTPTITLLGDSSVTISVGDNYTDAGATATDTRYGDITDDIVTVNNVNTSVAGTYTVTYNITTEDGYGAEEVVRTVVVEESSFNPEEVTIGTQTWMAVNLDIDDGMGGIYAYGNNETNVATYGRLYTWAAALRVAASIDGWHLPSDAEWQTLVDYLGGASVAGGKLKETGTTHWVSPNTGATNESGFTALPGGIRISNGTFIDVGDYGYWWSATEGGAARAWYRGMIYDGSSVLSYNYSKEVGFSVRLIKN